MLYGIRALKKGNAVWPKKATLKKKDTLALALKLLPITQQKFEKIVKITVDKPIGLLEATFLGKNLTK